MSKRTLAALLPPSEQVCVAQPELDVTPMAMRLTSNAKNLDTTRPRCSTATSEDNDGDSDSDSIRANHVVQKQQQNQQHPKQHQKQKEQRTIGSKRKEGGDWMDKDSCAPSLRQIRPGSVTIAETTAATATTTAATAKATAESSSSNTKIISNSKNNDWRCGIVIDEGILHVDRRLHPERPARIQAIVEALQRRNLLERCIVLQQPQQHETYAEDDEASQFLQGDDFMRVHLPGYLKRLEKLSNDCSSSSSCHRSCRRQVNTTKEQQQQQQQQHQQLLCDTEAAQYDSIFITPHSLRQAKLAAAALCRLTAQALGRRQQQQQQQQHCLDSGFAIVRPPGHHAEPGQAGGYCLLNNIAIAAHYALTHCPARKIIIVDYDVHWGNGTQRIFETNPHVLYFSVHRKSSNFYPFDAATTTTTTTTGGAGHFVGTDEGRGYTVNVAWSSSGMGNAEYLAVWERLLLPMVRQFQPDLVLVSAGFDAAVGDVGQCCVTPSGFGELTRRLQQCLYQISGRQNQQHQPRRRRRPAPMVCALEGGYVRSTLGDCVGAVVEQLLRNPAADNGTNECTALRWTDIQPSAARNIQQTIEAQKPFWSCLNEGVTDKES